MSEKQVTVSVNKLITYGVLIGVIAGAAAFGDKIFAYQAELDITNKDIAAVQKTTNKQFEEIKETQDERYGEYKVNEVKRDTQIEQIKEKQTEQTIEQVQIKSQTEQTLKIVEKIYEEINKK